MGFRDSSKKMADDRYSTDSSDDSDNEIKITLKPRPDFSKMTPEELAEYDKRIEEKNASCVYCNSMGKDGQGHTKENCRLLQNTRCNWCGNYGHTGKYCEKKGEKPLEIRCLFCFRGKKDERFYMSHSIENCRFRREYDAVRPERSTYRQPKRHEPPPTTNHDELILIRRDDVSAKPEPEPEPILTDPILQALIHFDNEMKKTKMYEPTSPDNFWIEKEPPVMIENNYLLHLQRQNQMMLANLRIKK
jgi:hypothetical protein